MSQRQRQRRRSPLLIGLVLSLVVQTQAALTNLTIDDANLAYFTWTEAPNVSPTPVNPWAAISPGNPCDYCSAQPPTTDIFDQTWHDGSNNSAGSLTFQGSAVYIFGIDLDNPANITFTLDGQPAGFHYYAGADQFVFKTLFYSASGLSPSDNHTVAWVLHTTKTNGTTGLFDYALITVEDTASASASPTASAAPLTSPPKKTSKTGAIIGGVVGGVAVLAGVAIALAFLVNSRRKKRNRSERRTARRSRRPRRSGHIEPFAGEAAEGSSPAATSPGESKILDVAWANPTPASIVPTSPPSDLASASARATDSGSTTTATTTTAQRERERELEARLALLEAQVHQVVEPPPYVSPPPRD
ncbi:hypothetical protein C8F01DRAFT_1243972 [Mycena amicta]|nr:hypothetical protein C8F01DRAFT_1243972 [Mycena amicta]